MSKILPGLQVLTVPIKRPNRCPAFDLGGLCGGGGRKRYFYRFEPLLFAPPEHGWTIVLASYKGRLLEEFTIPHPKGGRKKACIISDRIGKDSESDEMRSFMFQEADTVTVIGFEHPLTAERLALYGK